MTGRLRCTAYQVASIRTSPDGPAPAFYEQDWLPGLKTELGVRIVDRESKTAYVVTVIDRKAEAPVLTSRWDSTFSGHRGGANWLTDAELAAVAVSFLRRRQEWMERNPRLATFPGFEYGEDTPRPSRARPALETVASEARLAIQAGVPYVEWFGRDPWVVSEPTAKRWVRAAREAGLLPEMSGRPGRPRKSKKDGTGS